MRTLLHVVIAVMLLTASSLWANNSSSSSSKKKTRKSTESSMNANSDKKKDRKKSAAQDSAAKKKTDGWDAIKSEDDTKTSDTAAKPAPATPAKIVIATTENAPIDKDWEKKVNSSETKVDGRELGYWKRKEPSKPSAPTSAPAPASDATE